MAIETYIVLSVVALFIGIVFVHAFVRTIREKSPYRLPFVHSRWLLLVALGFFVFLSLSQLFGF